MARDPRARRRLDAGQPKVLRIGHVERAGRHDLARVPSVQVRLGDAAVLDALEQLGADAAARDVDAAAGDAASVLIPYAYGKH